MVGLILVLPFQGYTFVFGLVYLPLSIDKVLL